MPQRQHHVRWPCGPRAAGVLPTARSLSAPQGKHAGPAGGTGHPLAGTGSLLPCAGYRVLLPAGLPASGNGPGPGQDIGADRREQLLSGASLRHDVRGAGADAGFLHLLAATRRAGPVAGAHESLPDCIGQHRLPVQCTGRTGHCLLPARRHLAQGSAQQPVLDDGIGRFPAGNGQSPSGIHGAADGGGRVADAPNPAVGGRSHCNRGHSGLDGAGHSGNYRFPDPPGDGYRAGGRLLPGGSPAAGQGAGAYRHGRQHAEQLRGLLPGRLLRSAAHASRLRMAGRPGGPGDPALSGLAPPSAAGGPGAQRPGTDRRGRHAAGVPRHAVHLDPPSCHACSGGAGALSAGARHVAAAGGLQLGACGSAVAAAFALGVALRAGRRVHGGQRASIAVCILRAAGRGATQCCPGGARCSGAKSAPWARQHDHAAVASGNV